jgi:hypothetical protein
MISIIAVYKIPSVKHAFLIVQSFDDLIPLKEKMKRMEYFDHILHFKDNFPLGSVKQWTIKILHEIEFLTVLKKNKSSPQTLELLTVNLLKQTDLHCETYSDKCVEVISNEDVIDIFI